MKTRQDYIDEVMDEFDFDKVLKVMKFLKWKWAFEEGGEVPSNTATLRRCARRLIKDAFKSLDTRTEDWNDEVPSFCATGGFRAEVWKDNSVRLVFTISEWEAYNEDAENFAEAL